MAIKLPCSEPGCPEQVDYEREVLSGVGELAARDIDMIGGGGQTKRVYLTCPRGHVHVYVLQA